MLVQQKSLFNKEALEQKVKLMYKNVALEPHQTYHFEMGRSLARKLGYPERLLDNVPTGAVDSFAGVGYHFGLADIRKGESVLDLGSGSGMDLFIAAELTGPTGCVTGIDMTEEQLEKSQRLAISNGYKNIKLVKGYIESLPFKDGEFDVVISNGVINLSPDKATLFKEISRVLKPNGRLAVSDIVTEILLPETISCDTTLWAACIGGAMQQDDLFQNMEDEGFQKIQVIHNTQYGFISKSAQGASRKFGVKSVSVRGEKIDL